MSAHTWKKKFLAGVTAACIGATSTFAMMPVPASEASSSVLGNVIAAGVSAAAARSQAKSYVKYYNSTEQGRQELFAAFQKKYGVNNDAALNSRLKSIMGNLSSGIAAVDPSIDDKPYLYFVNNDESFNAFCSLGHVMSVNTGMFHMLNRDDEIAVVLGHEMGHGQKDHTAKGIMKEINKKATAQMLVSAAGGGAVASVVGSLALNQSIAHSTKDQEWEADNLSFDYISHSGYNPGAAAAVWQRVIDTQGNNAQSKAASFFNPSDHPNNAARRDNYEKRLYAFSGNHVHVANGTVIVNKKPFVTPAPAAGMSGAERSYFVQGNLAAAYHNGHSKNAARAENGTVYLGAQAIITPVDGDESAEVLAARLNEIK